MNEIGSIVATIEAKLEALKAELSKLLEEGGAAASALAKAVAAEIRVLAQDLENALGNL